MHEVTTPELNRKKSIDADNQPVVSHNSSVVSKLETSENIKPKFTTKKHQPENPILILKQPLMVTFIEKLLVSVFLKKAPSFHPEKFPLVCKRLLTVIFQKKIR